MKRALVLFVCIEASTASAQVYLTRDEALKIYFPDMAVERKTVFLTDEQVDLIQKRAKAKVGSKIVTYYVGKKANDVKGYAFFDSHVVRTMPEALLTIIGPDSSVQAVEILAFYEPEDYLPQKRWPALLHGRKLNEELWLKRGVQNIVGATLSATAITQAVRRTLATFEIAIPKER